MLRPGGEMLYSTCTTAPEENEAIVQHLLDTFKDSVEIMPIELKEIPHSQGLKTFFEQKFSSKISKNVCRLWPHLHSKKWDSECFFLCKIQKKNGLPLPPATKARMASGLKVIGKNQAAEIFSRISKQFGIEKSTWKNYTLLDHGGALFLCSKEIPPFATKNAHRRVGLPLLDKHGNPSMAFALKFGKNANTNIVQLSKAEADSFLTGLDIALSSPVESKDGTPLFVIENKRCIGWGKALRNGTHIKNKVDRELIP